MEHFLRVADLDIARLVDLGTRMASDRSLGAGSLSGRSIGLFFQKPSTRTRISTEVAAIQLGAHPVVLGNEGIGLGTREAPEDVMRVMSRYLDLVALRVFDHRDLEAMAAVASIPVVNLLSDQAHPCQAVADVMTIAAHRPLSGAQVGYVGDGNNVCVSLMHAVTRSGGRIRIATPPGYEPPAGEVAEAGEGVTVVHDPRDAVRGAHAVYTDVWTSMGQESETARRLEAFAGFQVDDRLFGLADPDAIFLHCLPAHRGEEVTDGVMEHARSRVFDQAENRLHAVKAVIHTLVS